LDEPKTSSEFAVMLFAGIGEAYFLQSIWEQSYEYFSKALKSKGGSSDPYLNLRIGQILFEQGNLKKSEKALLKAYKGSGHFIFDGEDKKYFELIREIVG
jgi:tetratricopeptide (TPR) repeat protein